MGGSVLFYRNCHDKQRYNACYMWRRISRSRTVWDQLPNEIIEMIARKCILPSVSYTPPYWSIT